MEERSHLPQSYQQIVLEMDGSLSGRRLAFSFYQHHLTRIPPAVTGYELTAATVPLTMQS